MPGLDKILSTIEEQGKRQADAIIKDAEKRADVILSESKSAAEDAYNDCLIGCRKQCEHDYSAARSSAEAELKRELLALKIKCIDSVIENALNRINEMQDDEYFSAVLKMVSDHMRSGCGIIHFSARDLKRLPSGFEKNLNLLASLDNSSVTISNIPADIENGFILSYGNISENCSFRAIAEAERDTLRDKVADVLFK